MVGFSASLREVCQEDGAPNRNGDTGGEGSTEEDVSGGSFGPCRAVSRQNGILSCSTPDTQKPQLKQPLRVRLVQRGERELNQPNKDTGPWVQPRGQREPLNLFDVHQRVPTCSSYPFPWDERDQDNRFMLGPKGGTTKPR